MQQLLTQDHTKSLDELFQLATTIEAAEQETVKRSEVDRTTEEEPSVSALRNLRPPKGTQNKQSGLPWRQQQWAPRKQHTGKCASYGGDHARKTCRFISAKCHNCGKIGHIARVCGAKTVVITEQQPSESAVVTISQNSKIQMDVPPDGRSSNVSNFAPPSDAKEVMPDGGFSLSNNIYKHNDLERFRETSATVHRSSTVCL